MLLTPQSTAAIGDRVVPIGDLGGGGTVHLRAVLSIPDTAGNDLESTAAAVRLVVSASLLDAVVEGSTLDRVPSTETGRGGLPRTGTEVLDLLLLGLGAVGAGGSLVVAARRRRGART